jgi:NarL family two-component system response regulator LiaR
MIISEQVDELTTREIEVLRLMAQGGSNRQIAEQLQIEMRTVKYHATNIYAKLGVKTPCEAMVWAWQPGISAAIAE